MLIKNYPLHDMNGVFDIFENTVKDGGVHDDTIGEIEFLNKLFASLPPEAVEYGMQFLHGNRDLPDSCSEMMPLYIRFANLAEYLEKIDILRTNPKSPTSETIMKRKALLDSLDEHEKMFMKPLLGIKARDSEEGSGSSGLHLMNAMAPVFVCHNILQTALFYETKCGFHASHLEDEKMPHIRLTRDNVVIVLFEGDIPPVSSYGEGIYDLYIYVSEPFLLYNELKKSGVRITEELEEAKSAESSALNRQFVFEDNDGRKICVSLTGEL